MKEATLTFQPIVMIDIEVPDDFDEEKVNGMSNDELRKMFREEMDDIGEWYIVRYDGIEVEVS